MTIQIDLSPNRDVYVLGVDPGQVTGLAVFKVHNMHAQLNATVEAAFESIPEVLFTWVQSAQKNVVVCEMIRVPNASFNPIGLRVIGMLELLAWQFGFTIKFQYPVQLKGVRLRYKFKDLGPHATDAAHHVIAYLESREIKIAV